MRHKVQPSQQAAAVAASRTMRMTMPRQRATVGRRWHQSIMPCSWLRHSGRYSFIHSLHSAALFLMVFVVIEAIIRNMHSIFMFVIFSLAFFASLRLRFASFCFYCGTLATLSILFRFPLSLSLSFVLCPSLGPLLMAKTFNMRI